MKYLFILTFALFGLWGCTTSTEDVPFGTFPQTMVSSGSDGNSNFMSLETKRLPHGQLKVVVTAWESNFSPFNFLQSVNDNNLELRLIRRCGTLPESTDTTLHNSPPHIVYTKKTFEYVLPVGSERRLASISCGNLKLYK